MTNPQAQAHTCARTLTTPGLNPHDYNAAAHELLALLKERVPLIPYEKGHPLWTNAHIRSGLVVAPGYAQDSLAAGIYTAQIAKNLHQIITAHHAQNPESPLQLLYPACGPFFAAALVVALLWPASALQITLIEISSAALHMAETAATALGIRDRIAQFVHADATRWTPPQDYDVLLVSCLGTALSGEPQIAIAANLVHALKPEGTLLPARIELLLAAFDVPSNFQTPTPTLQPLTDTTQSLLLIDREMLTTLGRPENWQSPTIPLADIHHDTPWPNNAIPALFIKVELTPGHPLPPSATGSMLPLARPDLYALDQLAPNQTCTCHYTLEYKPGPVFGI